MINNKRWAESEDRGGKMKGDRMKQCAETWGF